ncbi:MAG: RimK family alpha-L-glutamate ligase [Thermoanaerobaculaceae bacterium]
MSDIGVLTARPDLAIYKELEMAGRTLGVGVRIIDALRLAALNSRPYFCQESQQAAAGLGAVLPRVGNWRPDSVLAVLASLRRAGVASLNEVGAIRAGRDHWETACALAAVGLPHPETVAGSEPETLAAAATGAFGFPCIVKQRGSRQGVGVIRCASRAELEAVLDSLWRIGDEVVVQRFCPPGGVSRRILVLDDEVLGATEHIAPAGEFRSNAARGAEVRAVAPDERMRDLSICAARAVGLGFAGVDLIPDTDRWVVAEVNPSPGWRHFAAATGLPVSVRLVEALMRRAGER